MGCMSSTHDAWKVTTSRMSSTRPCSTISSASNSTVAVYPLQGFIFSTTPLPLKSERAWRASGGSSARTWHAGCWQRFVPGPGHEDNLLKMISQSSSVILDGWKAKLPCTNNTLFHLRPEFLMEG